MEDKFKSWGAPQGFEESMARIEFLEGAKELQTKVDAGTLSDTAATYSMQERLVDALDPDCTYSFTINGNAVLPPPPTCVKAKADPVHDK